MESRKVLLYICGMSKTIKIPDRVHQELKRYIANTNNGTIEELSGNAIIRFLEWAGHKPLKPTRNKK